MTTPSLEEETANKVLRQVEFYFSDSNLPRDGFLKKSINESEDGMVCLALICSFSRMRNHLGLAGDVKPENVSEDTVQSVAEVLRKSSVLRVSEDGKKIGRSTELLKIEEVVEQLDIRTIAASPLEHDVTIEQVESFFTQYAKVNSVRLPRHVADKRFFCGTALIEFSTEEDAANVLTQSSVYAGAELELRAKKDFDAEREKMIEEVEKSQSFKGPKNKNNSDLNSDYPKGLIIAFKLKHTSGEGIAEGNGVQESVNGNGDACEKGKEHNLTENATEQSKEKVSENVEDGGEKSLDDIVKESREVVKETTEEGEEKETEDASEEKAEAGEKLSAAFNKDNKDIVLREDIKNVLQQFGTVKYVDFRMGADSGYVRFEEPEAGQKARAAAVLAEEGGLTVKNYIAFLEAVTGEAEKEYWSLFRGSQDKRWETKGNRGRGGRNFRGGRHNAKHGRSRENYSSAGRPNKSQKIASAPDCALLLGPKSISELETFLNSYQNKEQQANHPKPRSTRPNGRPGHPKTKP